MGMKTHLYYYIAIVCIILGTSCTSEQKQHATEEHTSIQKENVATQPDKAQFPFPDIPVMLTEPEERREFLLAHYWDNFNFSDTTLLNNRDITEQGFVNHISLLADGESSSQEITKSLDALCSHIEQQREACKTFMHLFDEYLYNPNSPLYNEALYLVYLNRMLQSKTIDDATKSTLAFKQKLISRNQPGTLASDFTYYLPNGQASKLHQTPASNNRLLLIFYDPECPSCHEIMQDMLHDQTLADAVTDGKLTVLAIYTEGNPEAWRSDLSNLPANWMVGTDREAIKLNALYDLKAMPSLYLLDGNKKVILKDAPYARIRAALHF